MAKLNTETARKVEKAEDGFKPVPDGVYVLELREDVEVGEGGKGPYWKWTFEVPETHDGKDLDYAGRRFWTNTSLSEAAFFKLKETFAAFGVPTDTDTEDLVKKRVKAVIVTGTIQQGARKGEERSEIQRLLPLDADDPDVGTSGAGASPNMDKGGSTEEPLF
jgi:hypothetical protein